MGITTGNDNYAFDTTPVVSRKSRGSVTLSSIDVAGLGAFTETKNDGSSPKKDMEAEDDKLNPVNQSWFPKRTIIMEPVFTMLFMFHIGSFSLTGQYMLYAFGEKYNLTAVRDAERAASNVTTGGGGSKCSPDAGGNRNSTAYDLQQQAQAENARFNIYMDLISEIPGFFITLIFGKIMDRLGRKPCMIIPMVGFIFRGFIYILQMTLNLPIEIILLTGVSDALTGGMGTFMNAGYAFFADTLPKEKRGRRLAINDIAYGLFLAGMSYGMGYMIQYWGFMWPLVICIGGHFLNLTYILFFVPETRRKTTTWKKISPTYMVDCFKVYPKKRPNQGRKFLLLFVAAYLVMTFSRARGIDNLYRLNDPFCWTPILMGTYSMIKSLLMNVAQVFVAIFLFKPLGDLGVIIMGVSSWVLDEMCTGFAILLPALLWAVPVVGCLSGVQGPVMRAQMSKLVGPGEQGALFSSMNAVSSVIGIGSSAMYNTIYAESLYFYKGTVFFVVAFFVSIYLTLVIIFQITYTKHQRELQAAETTVEVVNGTKETMEKF